MDLSNGTDFLFHNSSSPSTYDGFDGLSSWPGFDPDILKKFNLSDGFSELEEPYPNLKKFVDAINLFGMCTDIPSAVCNVLVLFSYHLNIY